MKLHVKAYAALAKAEAAAKAAKKSNCDEYKMDKKGKCPGDTGYVSFVKEDVPQSFAVSHLLNLNVEVKCRLDRHKFLDKEYQ